MAFSLRSVCNPHGPNRTERLSIYALISLVFTFVTLGLTVSASGPSVMFFEEVVYTWEDEIALVFTGRAVGAIGGWLFSHSFLEDVPKHCGSLFGFGLLGLIIVNFCLVFSHYLWWLLAAFAFQGAFIVVAAQGCFAYVNRHSGSPKMITQILVFFSLAGCALTPVLFVPLSHGPSVNATVFLTPVKNVSALEPNAAALRAIVRPPRSANEVSEAPVVLPTTAVQITPSTTTASSNSQAPTLLTSTYSFTDAGFPISTLSPGSKYPAKSTTPVLTDLPVSNEHNDLPVSIPAVVEEPSSSVESVTLSRIPSINDAFKISEASHLTPATIQGANIDQSSSDVPSNVTLLVEATTDYANDMGSIPVTTDETTTAVTNSTEAPMKPSVVDAEHLNQDSKTADGSKTAAKMKQVDEDVRLVNSQESEVAEVQNGEVQKPSVVDATHLSQDRKTADGSSTADIMKQVNEKLQDVDPDLPPIIAPTEPPHVANQEPTLNTTERQAEPPPVTTAAPRVKNATDTQKTPPVEAPAPVASPSVVQGPALRSNDSYRLTSSYNSRWDRRTPRHWRDGNMREQYMKAVRYVYMSVSLLTVVAWFILLPLTGLVGYVRPFFECFTIRTASQSNDKNDVSVGSHTIEEEGAASPVVRSKSDGVLRTDVGTSEEQQAEESARTENVPKIVSWSANSTDEIVDANSGLHVSVSVPNLAVLRSVRHNHSQLRNGDPSVVHPGEAVDLNEQSVYLNYAPEPTNWPLVKWPSDFWVLAACFLFGGLETTYGAFIHSFTMRTLHWTPVDSLLVTAVFWCGDALGRVCHACLGSGTDMGVSMLQFAFAVTPKEEDPSPVPSLAHRNSRRERSFRMAGLFIRTVGSLICLICANMLREMTTSHLVYLAQDNGSASEILESWSSSRDRATWASTLGLGLGLGAVAGSGLNTHQAGGHRLYLSFLLGQLAVPATSGYLTERVYHKNASETLGRTAVILSVLMFLSLLCDLALRVMRQFAWWKKITNWIASYADHATHTQRKASMANTEAEKGGRPSGVIQPAPSAHTRPSIVDVEWGQPLSSSSIPLETKRVHSDVSKKLSAAEEVEADGRQKSVVKIE